ncbi:hypothetical protein NX059_008167 [Plenodomus lindquistii]|nr:hypothetical protein NX059_008167 [Plenodomus lindquistii]
MTSKGPISIVGVHAEGEVGDVIVGGVLDPPNCKTMYEKLVHFRDNADQVRRLLMQEPRGRVAQCMNLILAPCHPDAQAGVIIMESDEYAPMSGSNTICTATVLLETGMLDMQEPTTGFTLEAAAGLVKVTADCENGKCKAVAFDNVPAFVYTLDLLVDVPGFGKIFVDVAWGGMHYVLVDAASVGLTIDNEHGAELVRVGELIKTAVHKTFTPIHPDNSDIRELTILEFTEHLKYEPDGSITARNTVVVSPGRLDRSPCGSGTSARMAVLHARGLLKVGHIFRHRSIIGTEFVCELLAETKIGEYNAVTSRVKGRAWLTGFRQATLDPSDPFPNGFRVGDAWPMLAME